MGGQKRIRSWVALFVIGVMVLAGCGGSKQTQQQKAAPAASSSQPAQAPAPAQPSAADKWKAVEEAAKKEGELVWYTTFPEKQANAMLAEFTKKYGIKASLFRGTGSSVAQRFEQETRANRHAVDVISIASMAPVLKWKNDKWLGTLSEMPSLKDYGAGYQDKDGMWVWGALSATGIMYNTNLVKTADAPKSWAELFDPRWSGKVALVGPWVSDVSREWAFYIENHVKMADAAKKMGALKPYLGKVHADSTQAVSSGERAVGMSIDYTVAGQKAKGAPIALIYPKDGTSITPRPFIIPAKAPHPNAAKVFLNWLLSEEGQTIIGKQIRFHSVRTGQQAPDGLPSFTELKGSEIDPTALGKVSKELGDRWKAALGQ